MESPEKIGGGRKGLRCFLIFALCVFAFFLIAFVNGFIAISVSYLLVQSPSPVAAQCKIVSSSVDIRSAEVCELGLFNFKAKNVLYPLAKKQFRCHYDYYWASVFKVEYRDVSSGDTRYAWAEAPKEALPLDCRPNFGIAWLTKDKFKVNETYNCKYTPGNPKVDIHSDCIFDCRSENPSILEMIKRYCIIFSGIINSASSASSSGAVRFLYKGFASGFISGIVSSIGLITLIRLVQVAKLRLLGMYRVGKQCKPVLVHFRQACFLVACVSAMGWLILESGKLMGISELINRMLVSAR